MAGAIVGWIVGWTLDHTATPWRCRPDHGLPPGLVLPVVWGFLSRRAPIVRREPGRSRPAAAAARPSQGRAVTAAADLRRLIGELDPAAMVTLAVYAGILVGDRARGARRSRPHRRPPPGRSSRVLPRRHRRRCDRGVPADDGRHRRPVGRARPPRPGSGRRLVGRAPRRRARRVLPGLGPGGVRLPPRRPPHPGGVGVAPGAPPRADLRHQPRPAPTGRCPSTASSCCRGWRSPASRSNAAAVELGI